MDIARSLLAAIDALLDTEIQTGGSLDDAGSYFVIYTSGSSPPDFGTVLPLIVVKMGIVTSETISIPPCMMKKVYPVIFGVFTEDNGDKEDSTAAQILDSLEDLFFNNTLGGLSQWVDVTSKDYTQTSIPSFSGDWSGSGELIMTHINTDVRSL